MGERKRNNIWEHINHKLVALKLEETRQENIKSIHAYLDFVMEAQDDPQPQPIVEIQSWILNMDDWCRDVYAVYEKLWEKQGGAKTPGFIRAVCEKGILPSIDKYVRELHKTFDKYAQPSSRTPTPAKAPNAFLEDLLRHLPGSTMETIIVPTSNYDIHRHMKIKLEALDRQADECRRNWLRKCEIEAVELESMPPSETFSHSPDYRSVTFMGNRYSLTGPQAKIIKILHEAHESGNPEVSGDFLLAEVEAPSSRLVDIFKSRKKAYKALVSSETRGIYRLKLD